MAGQLLVWVLWLSVIGVALRDVYRRDFRGHTRGSAALILLSAWTVASAVVAAQFDALLDADTARLSLERIHAPIAALCSGISLLGLVRDEARGRALVACLVSLPLMLCLVVALSFVGLPD